MPRAVKEITRRHRLTVNDYHRMGEVGIIGQNTRVELVGGDVIDMAPIGSTHAGMVRRLEKMLHDSIADSAIISVQNPVVLNQHSEPQPDLAVLKMRNDFYAAAHPEASDILLIIEVSDTTLRYDLETKLPLYAQAEIPEVWLIDIANSSAELFRNPGRQGYQEIEKPVPGTYIESILLPTLAIPVNNLWAPEE